MLAPSGRMAFCRRALSVHTQCINAVVRSDCSGSSVMIAFACQFHFCMLIACQFRFACPLAIFRCDSACLLHFGVYLCICMQVIDLHAGYAYLHALARIGTVLHALLHAPLSLLLRLCCDHGSSASAARCARGLGRRGGCLGGDPRDHSCVGAHMSQRVPGLGPGGYCLRSYTGTDTCP